MKTGFKTRVSRMGLSSFEDINIFVMKYFLFSFFIFSILVLNQIYKNVKTPKNETREFRSTILF